MAHRIFSEPWVSPKQLIPWSSRVSFSNEVCGLPGAKGCWRHRRCQGIHHYGARLLKKQSIGIDQPDVPDQPLWLIFHKAIEDGLVATHVGLAFSEVDRLRKLPDHHVVLFEFDRSADILEPSSYECWAWFGGRHNAIDDWWKPLPGSTKSLFDCFGKELFVDRDLSQASKGARGSIADLLTAYLNRRCSHFRQHERGLNFGVSWCHLETRLLERAEKEQRCLESTFGLDSEREEEPPFCLDHYLVTFSVVEPKTLLLNFLPEPHILRLDLDESFRGLRNSIHKAVPLRSNPKISEAAQERICYADCLTSHSRVQLQGSEIDRSFLCFSLAEIALYLLDWLLCRLLSESDGRDDSIGKSLRRIIEASGEADELVEAFDELLGTQIRLDLDWRLFEPAARGALSADKATYLGAFGSGSTVRDILKAIDLANWNSMVPAVIEFLVKNFSVNATGDYRDLPMFNMFGWQTDSLLVESDWNDQAEASAIHGTRYPLALVGILRSIASVHASLSREEARLRGQALLDRSVFPVAQMLSHWPRGKKVRNYFIFPVWESLVGANYRSAIFAHVFSARPESNHDDEADAVVIEGDFLNEQLLPFGRLIAQSSYDAQLRQSQIDDQLASAAYSVGHPLKRRVDSVHATLNSLLDLGPDRKMQTLIHEAGAAALRVGRLGHVLDVLADALRPGEQRPVFRVKDEWSQEEPLLLSALLQRLDGSTLAPGFPKVRISTTGSHYERIRIGCWLADENGRTYRPADLFYEELFYELLLNAAKHGAGNPDDVRVDIDLTQPRLSDEGLKALTLRNGIGSARSRGPSDWSLWNHDGNAPVGGLFFLSNLLSRVGLGRLWTRFHQRHGKDCFSVALELTGLEEI